tara:strand:+ start:105 stop:707 length:603 start_codon:yes stop_codon:yes gene_type:complete
MSNNLFYKTLSIIGTLGIVVLSSTQIWTTFKKQTDTESEISKTLLELKQARKETLSEINLIKKEVLKELNSMGSETLEKVETIQKSTLSEVKTVKSDLLNELDSARVNSVKEIKNDKTLALDEIRKIKSEALTSIKRAGGNDEDGVAMIIRYTGGGGTTMATVPMQTLSQCEIAGATMEASKRFTSTDRNIGFECVETGK